MTRHEIKIEGMACSGCSSAVENALKQHPQVQSAEVSHEQGLARVESDLEPSDIAELIKKAGYEPKLN